MTLDYEFNDPSDRESLYTRSDHYSYASKGIPVIFFTTGLHPDYHANTDEVSKIEFDKMTRVGAVRLRDRRPAGEPRSRAGPRRQGRTGARARRIADHPVTRPLLIIFLTIFVNLIGFGIIIPLLPFYAETFGASPIVIGLLFAVFSVCQLMAAPMLGDWSDRYGRRPMLIFSLLGTVVSFVMLALAHSVAMLFVARIVDGLSGGNISTARAYVADVTEPKDRARAYGLIGAAFGLGFIFGPALSGVLAQGQLHRADLGGRDPDAGGDGGGLALAAGDRPSRAGGHRHAVPESARDAAPSGARPHAGHRFRLLVRVRDLPDDVRAVRRPAVSVRRVADRLLLRRRSAFSAPSCRAASSGRSCAGSATNRRSSSGWCVRRSDWSRRP